MTSNDKSNNRKSTVIARSTALLLATFAATPAFAKACKNVHLEVKNETSKPIKILDLDYWDSESEKWRSEPVRNETIHKNRTWQENRNLERVNGQPVKVRIKYKKMKWSKFSKKWVKKGKTIRVISPTKQCARNSEFLVRIK